MFGKSRFSLVLFAAVMACFLQPSLAWSQVGGPRSSTELIDLTTHTSVEQVPAGSGFAAAVVVEIQPGWKVNSHRPTLDFLIPTQLTVEPQEGVAIERIVYPEGKLQELEFAEEPLSVYEGRVVIYVQIQTDESLSPGEYELAAQLRVQGCDDNVCLAPANQALAIPFQVGEPDSEATPQNEALFADFEWTEPAEAEETSGVITATPGDGTAGEEVAAMFDERGWILAFVGIFVMGLALNLTPCVYPMLSVTVSLFSRREGAQIGFGSSFLRASLYVLGIVSMYTGLGVAAAFTGALFGGWLQSPVVLAGIGTLFLILALSMFGLYELQPPSSLMNRLGGAQQVAGPLGLYLSGLVVGVFAAPCIGPPIIALLAYVGARGDAWFGFLAFFLLSLGLGFPYLLLGSFSGLLTKMPRSGEWMIWIRKLFGVVLVGLALYYLLLAFQPRYAPWMLPATLLIGGIYLGFLERSGRSNRWFRRLQWAVGVLAIIGGAHVYGRMQREGVVWEPYSEAKVVAAREAGQPVMLDFYADWCIPCQELELFTFTDPRVVEATQSFRRLKVDLTNFDSPEAEEVRERFQVAGVPTVVFLGPEGTEVPQTRVLGFVGADEFLTRVQRTQQAAGDL